MKIYYDLNLQSQTTPDGIGAVKKPILFYGTAPVWQIHLTEDLPCDVKDRVDRSICSFYDGGKCKCGCSGLFYRFHNVS